MIVRRIFLDTVFIQALLSPRDKFHLQALVLSDQLLGPLVEFVTTDAVLIEVANAFSNSNRKAAIHFVDEAYEAPNTRILGIDANLFRRARQLYRSRIDKQWGMTDCISFIVMSDYQITDALTADHHFEQAGFTILMK